VHPTSLPDQPPSRRKAHAPDGAAAERQLARWIAEGDDEALAELFDLVGPILYSLALGITHEARLAEHAVEHTLAELWERRPGLGRLPALSPWLLERCRAWAIALRTSTQVAPPRLLEEVTSDNRLVVRLLRCPPSLRPSKVSAALERLSPPERQVVLLAIYGGLSVAEIDQRMGIGKDQVIELLRNGLRLLRDDLERTLRRELP
jgi:RNA polymerase sigma-70 factor (ECF subfamily)